MNNKHWTLGIDNRFIELIYKKKINCRWTNDVSALIEA